MNFTDTMNILKNNFLTFVILLLFLSINNVFFNVYAIYIRDHDERMLRTYGYCEGVSYGYINQIKEKNLKDKKLQIINFDLSPLSIALFSDLQLQENSNNLILLNYNIEKLKLLEERNVDLNKYILINSVNNCMYYKKK